MPKSSNVTTLSSNDSQKAKMIANRLRSFADALRGRSNLKTPPNAIVALMDDAAELLERLRRGTREHRLSTDIKFMDSNPGKFFVRQGIVLVRKAFDTASEAKEWAKYNYRSEDGWTILF